MRNALQDLLEDLGEVPQCDLPALGLREDAVTAGERLRDFVGISVREQMTWRNANKAYQAWRDALLDRWILTLQLPVPRNEMRGFSLLDERLSVIVATSQDEVQARIFSVFHELVHLCLRLPGVSHPSLSRTEGSGVRPTIERFCNLVAAEFLMPSNDQDVRNVLQTVCERRRVDTQALRSAATRLSVSQHAILVRLTESGMVEQRQYDEIVSEWDRLPKQSAGGPIKRHDKAIGTYGRRFASIVLEALDAGIISVHTAGQLLSIQTPMWVDRVRERLVGGATGGP